MEGNDQPIRARSSCISSTCFLLSSAGETVSTRDFKGSAHWVKTLMAQAAKDIAEGGEIKAAKVLNKGPNLAKVHIGWLKRRLLRGEFRRRA